MARFTLHIDGLPTTGFDSIGSFGPSGVVNCRCDYVPIIPDPILTRRERTLRALPGSPWEVLGVDRNASQATIETAFRQRLEESFPDPELKLTRAYMRAREMALSMATARDRSRARRKERYGPTHDTVYCDDPADSSSAPSHAQIKEVFEEIFGGRANNPTMTVVHSKAKREDDGSINVTIGNKIALRF